jgi:HEAT repeat protein
MHTSNASEAVCQPQIAEAVQQVVERLKDEESNVRQAVLVIIPKLANVGESSSSLSIYISNPFQAECSPKIAGALPQIMHQLEDDDDDVRQATLEAITKLAAVG